MNTRLRLTVLAAFFTFLTPFNSVLQAQFPKSNANTNIPDGTRKCIKPKERALEVTDLLKPSVPTTCVAPVTNVSIRSGNESESFVLANPTNPNNLVTFSNLASENSIFRAYSTNAGATWTRGTVATNVACCDGQAAWDTFGNLFLVYINNSVNQINVILSTDGGVTFSAPLTVGTGSVDQPSIAVGNGSVWVDWNSSGNMVARGAPVTGLGTYGPFGAQQTIPSASGSFGGIAVGPGPNGGKVIVTYQSPTGGQGPATIYANVDADGLGAGGFGARITVSTTNVGGFDFIPAQNGRSIDAEAGMVWDATGGPFNNRIYLVYTEETVNENNDTDIMVRTSTDDGATWTAPVRVNDDPPSPIRSQFLPYIALDPTTGTVAVGFHDCRNDNGVPGPGGTNSIPNDDAEYFGTYSTDGGVTWAPNVRLSGGFSNAAAAANGIDFGDYVGLTAYAGKLNTLWADNANCDGTNANGTLHAFDLYSDPLVLPAGGGCAITVPVCSTTVSSQPNDFPVNLGSPVNPGTVQASDFMVNGISANSFVISGDQRQIIFHFNSSPVTTQGVQTIHIAAGAFDCGMPNAEFNCTFCYAITALQVTSTVPAVGGTFSPPAPGDYSYDVIFNQNIDAASVSTSDLTITGIAGSVTAVTVSGNTAHFTLHFNSGGSVTLSIAVGTVTANTCNGNAAFSGMYTVQGCPPSDHYTISQIGGSIVPGTTDIGNHGDDTVTTVALPFSYTLYDQIFTSVNLSSNGNAQFVTTDTAFTNSCLPWTTHDYTIFPYWDDLYLVNSGFGIFTSISGTAPNRIFNIEFRAQYFPGSGTANFELRLYEGQTRFDVIYGTVTNGNTSATGGVQKNDTAFDQYFCNGSGSPATGGQSYILVPCNQVTVTGAVSRKTHGAAGTFDVALPLTGTDGVECRSTGGTNDYTMVVTFSGNVTVTGSPQAQLTMGTGCVGSGGVCTGNVAVSGNVVTVPLTNVTDQQNINVRINGVNSADAPATDINIPMGVLVGDTNANRAVNASDVSQTKGQSGQPVTATNFRSDVNANGSINAGDINIVKANSGHSIP